MSTAVAEARVNAHEREPSTVEWMWVMRKLNKRDLISGVTDRHVRVERWRKEILRRGWGFADSAAGRRSDGTLESWAALFLRATGELLDATHVITGETGAVNNGGNNGGSAPKKNGDLS